MSAIEVFQFPTTGQQIRTIVRDGEPLFCVADVCRGLQHSNPSVALKLTDEDDRVMVDLRETDSPSLNRTSINPDMWFVTESGFFALALTSQAPNARAFRRWVTHEVLPVIRRTGSYGAPAAPDLTRPEGVLALAEAYVVSARKLVATQAALAVAEPKAEAWDVLASTDGDFDVRRAAHMLNRDPAINTGRDRLFAAMQRFKMIDAYNVPYASHSKHVRLRATSYEHPHTGELVPKTQLRITLAGLHYLQRRLGGTKQLTFDFPREEVMVPGPRAPLA